MKTSLVLTGIVLMSLFTVNPVFCSDQEVFDQKGFNSELIEKAKELHADIYSNTEFTVGECMRREDLMNTYEAYYAQPVNNLSTKILYAARYFKEALELEKYCSSGNTKNRFDFTRSEYFDRMQSTLVSAYAAHLKWVERHPEEGHLNARLAFFEEILDAFSQKMNPETKADFQDYKKSYVDFLRKEKEAK